MTDRGLPIVDGAPACPFVAFEDDRDARGTAPDHRHRCYAEPRPAPRAAAHQEAYCLSSAFPVCPTFQDWARREAAIARAKEVDDEDELPPLDEPDSEPLPPPERPARRAPDTDTPPPLAPRRNPPRDWAAPPPWTGDEGDGAAAEPPPFLAPAAPVAPAQPTSQPASSVDRTADDAAYGAASRGLAGSAADRLAGSYGSGQDFDDDDPSYAPSSAGYSPSPAAYDRPVPIPPTSPERAPASSAGRQGRGQAVPTSAAASSGRQPSGQAKPQHQDPAELFGPAWERPRRYEAYPSLRTRVGLPAIGSPPRIVVAGMAVVLAAVVLFFVGPMLLGVGSNDPGAGAPATVAPADATASPIPTTPPEPTPKIYVVAKGDTISKIARKNHVTVEQLLAANPKIKNPNLIKVGDKVTIPVPEPDGAGSAAP